MSDLVNRISDLVNWNLLSSNQTYDLLNRRFPFTKSDVRFTNLNQMSDLVNRRRGTLYIEGERGIFEKVVTTSKM